MSWPRPILELCEGWEKAGRSEGRGTVAFNASSCSVIDRKSSMAPLARLPTCVGVCVWWHHRAQTRGLTGQWGVRAVENRAERSPAQRGPLGPGGSHHIHLTVQAHLRAHFLLGLLCLIHPGLTFDPDWKVIPVS